MIKLLRLARITALFIAVAVPAFALISHHLHSQTNERIAVAANLTGVIGPASTHFIAKAIETATERQAELLILRINTPGGLVTSMRDIIEDIIASPVPVVGYVGPSGAHAASAGTYILYATHVAAMAPGTNIGAATPVQMGGLPTLPSPADDLDKTRKQPPGRPDGTGKDTPATKDLTPGNAPEAKAMNDALAFIRSLAELRGRNAEWAEQAVRQAATLSAEGAKREGVVEIVAADMEALLIALDGRKVKIGNRERTLFTRDLQVQWVEPGFVAKILAIITNPNVALIFMMIGIYGLIFEFANPGTIGPGIVGVICLILGLYSLNQLPLDYAGLALITVGVILMTIEAFTPSFGVFGLGGIAAFIIGATMLVDTDVPAYQLSWSVIAGTAVASGAILVLMLGYVWRAHQNPVQRGRSHLTGGEAEVLDWSGHEGHVWAEGERWAARSRDQFRTGDKVRIRDLDGLTLNVERE